MYDRMHRIQGAFAADTVGVPLDPETFEDHLDFATEYQLAMYRLGGRVKRDETRPFVRDAPATRQSLMELRALFLFAVAEHKAAIDRHRRLPEPERCETWLQLEGAEVHGRKRTLQH